MTIPLATYRLQLNKDFTFGHARTLVPYLADLGISHAYLSPILKAQPGSTHGYDTVNHRLINPELGTIEDFRALAKTLADAGMGIILDFVPNHMGVGGSQNWLWLDVLKHGPESQYADWFDIDWNPRRPDLAGKLMVPFLGTSYADALANGDLQLKVDDDGLAVWAYGTEKLPIRTQDQNAILNRYGSLTAATAALNGNKGEPTSWAALDSLIGDQHWRPIHFSTAHDEINYRRFFINSELAGIRIDRPEVFDHAHQVIFSLIDEGLVDGLRIDHVDGLLDPTGYLKTLKEKSPRTIYLAIEKILAPHEQLRADWPVDGTTGYEFGAQLTRVLTSAAGEEQVTKTYQDFVGAVPDPHEEAYHCKLRVMEHELAAELAGLARCLADLAWSAPATRDLSEHGLRKAMRETIAHLGVYRTYIDDQGINDRDRREISLALGRARQYKPHYLPALFNFIEHLLLGTLGTEYDPKLVAAAVGKFQQYTGPVMAKGLEDTALYRYNRLVSLNEVGAHPDRFSLDIAAFHDGNQRRLAGHPLCLLGTSTHDTKRGEDTRAMIGAIADRPDVWDSAVKQWRDMLGSDYIHPNDLYLFFQLLHGGWPIAGDTAPLAERLKGAMEKSLREARERSDWGVNNTEYEAMVASFIDNALGNADFMACFHELRTPLVQIGQRKALIQVALKLTSPGVPDIYRGAEDWEQSFVDPDNRRPVDFSALRRRLAGPNGPVDQKLVLTQKLLRFRQSHPELFTHTSYQPIDMGETTLAFLREAGNARLLVMADLSPGHDAGLSLPQNLAVQQWTDVITGSAYSLGERQSVLVLWQ
ncbi:malto-oligosyltrehalose synthase [Devosia naphthalenivorans]|uniref:malto-oligosyltrehalose synthase n=1 Tax=Devosia naphthalenivorans TaxID=2082392 RepID=UPI0013B05229|nr:malto-oligosyltrehalose synthase [Devosia naphthalenivorans]